MLSLFELFSANPALQGQFNQQLGTPINTQLATQLGAQANLLATLSQRSHELLARLTDLNLQMARHVVETALDTGRQLAACTDPLQVAPTAMRGWQPLGEHVRAWQQGLMGVMAEAQTGLGHAAALAPAPAKRPA
ncbi:phasin family protein [Massilia sp. CFBP9012]|uniref:phasin family protein n=1 Tax=Massilia sp. CFBP9012 TaxID=3096531 RepID=UPI002A6B8745|nr:phasin family protein [Massilia sp. CFBP9012]MDY0976909.1 phasin family protein [Massilia sp. CFBP9012]